MDIHSKAVDMLQAAVYNETFICDNIRSLMGVERDEDVYMYYDQFISLLRAIATRTGRGS